MTFYQNVAENGVSVCQGPRSSFNAATSLAGLPRADGLILVDAHPGNPVNSVRSINPAVIDENRPDLLNSDLDPFNPKNGFNPKGPSTYSDEFKKKYFRAQAERMNRLIDKAQAVQRQMKEGKYNYPDDDAFLGGPRRRWPLDATRPEHSPGYSEASETDQKRRQDRNGNRQKCARGESEQRAAKRHVRKWHALFDPAVVYQCQRWRATDSMDGIDHCTSNNSPPCHLPAITVPTLVTAMGSLFYSRQRDSLRALRRKGQGFRRR